MSRMLKELGVKPVINACGTVTVLGGCLVDDEVLEAVKEAAGVYVDMSELHTRAGAYIAKLTGAEAAYISAGAAAGLVLSVAACMTMGQTELMTKLPRTEGMKNEVVVQKLHRNMYDYNLEIPGARLVEIGNEHRTRTEDLERAINEKTAAVVYFVFDPQSGVLSLGEVIETAHKRGVPVIVDAAAELPPKENLTKFIKMKADLVVFSGGKDIGAPNDTGIILGRRDLIGNCMRLGPHSYEVVNSKRRVYFGRPMKSSKEDILALVVALRRYLAKDHTERIRESERKADYMIMQLSGFSSVGVRRVEPGPTHNRPACFPRVELEFKNTQWSADSLAAQLKKCDPPIYTYLMNERLYLNPQCLRDGEEGVVVSNIKKLLS
jgi:L-seryl-tRNA(Ser) seleniumtransferase